MLVEINLQNRNDNLKTNIRPDINLSENICVCVMYSLTIIKQDQIVLSYANIMRHTRGLSTFRALGTVLSNVLHLIRLLSIVLLHMVLSDDISFEF
jgi:hypothetical protein